MQDLLRRHPEILRRTMPDPIVVVGLARSGTTRLHRLLAADQHFLHLAAWESVYPVPYPACFAARDAGRADPRIAALDQGLRAVLYMSPQIAAVHPLGTLEVEEEVGLIQHGFSSQLFEIQAKIPSFAEWLMTHDQSAAYERARGFLDPIAERAAVKAGGSACSMAWNAIVRDSDTVTPQWVGQEWLHKTERMLHKTLRVREELAPDQNQYDIQYADINVDWEQAMRGVYDFLALPFTDRTRSAMQAWIDGNQQHKHGAHQYTLADFGLDQGEVERHLRFYREKFNIPYETNHPHTTANRQSAGESP